MVSKSCECTGESVRFCRRSTLVKVNKKSFCDSGLICDNNLLTTSPIEDVIRITNKTDTSITFNFRNEHISLHTKN